MKKLTYTLVLLLLIFALAGCRNETQNRIRRSIQDYTGQRLYITVYAWDGTPVYSGIVDGKVTRSEATLAGTNEAASGSYVFWYDETGQYHQTSLPYFATSEPQPTSRRAP